MGFVSVGGLGSITAPRCSPAGRAWQDFEAGNLYGLEKFWAFHHYTGLPQGSGLDIDPKVLTDESAPHPEQAVAACGTQG